MSHTPINSAPPAEVVEAFSTAAVLALQELTQSESFADDPPTATTGADDQPGSSATLRLGRALPGRLTLVLATDVAHQLAERFLPPGTELTDDLVDDFVGELGNVIAGQAKTMLKGTPYHFAMSTPVVSRAATVADSITTAGHSPAVALNFEAGRLLLYVELLPCEGA